MNTLYNGAEEWSDTFRKHIHTHTALGNLIFPAATMGLQVRRAALVPRNSALRSSDDVVVVAVVGEEEEATAALEEEAAHNY